MSNASPWTWLGRLGVWTVALLIPAVLSAAPPEPEVVDVFSGIEQGKIEVRLIAQDSAKCNLLVTNKTDRPLSVRLPEAFAGVPVLAQPPWNPPPFNPNLNPNQNQNNSPQRLGLSPMMNPGMNNGLMNIMGPNVGQNRGMPNMMPGPIMNIPPEKVGKLKLPGVCLDFGKPNPSPQMKYEIRPIESCAEKDGVAEVVAMLGRGEISQRVAQLAAWNLNNDVSWEELGSLRQQRVLAPKPIYSREELSAGKKVVEKVVESAKKQKPSRSSNGDSSR
ncbi:MAG TPA: hypothetical protein VMY42_16420 [Thermoguttaceae bacterium]|nr:hypothetical protein [Thermoguttaceae bacterium]